MTKSLTTLLLSLLLISGAQARNENEVRHYDVELIVFERNDPAAAKREFWPAVAERPGPGISLSRAGFPPLETRQRELKAAHLALARSPAYTPLAYLSWRQPGLNAAQAVPVRIQSGQSFDMPAESDTPGPLRQLEGTVKVVLGRYLHVYADLLLRRPMPEGFVGENRVGGLQETADDSGAGFREPTTQLHEFQMRQHRRMRRNEVHYLDHPMMGMLVLIRRAQPNPSE